MSKLFRPGDVVALVSDTNAARPMTVTIVSEIEIVVAYPDYPAVTRTSFPPESLRLVSPAKESIDRVIETLSLDEGAA